MPSDIGQITGAFRLPGSVFHGRTDPSAPGDAQYTRLHPQDLDPALHAESGSTDGSDVLFSLYNQKAGEYDRNLAMNWREDAQGIMLLSQIPNDRFIIEIMTQGPCLRPRTHPTRRANPCGRASSVRNGVRLPRAGISAILHEHTHDFIFAEHSMMGARPRSFRRFGSAPRSTRPRTSSAWPACAASMNSPLPITLIVKCSVSKRVRTTEKTKQKEEVMFRGICDVPCSFVRFGESPASLYNV